MHFLVQRSQSHATNRVTHEVGSLHTFFHFVADHVAPVASGETHHESEVTFLDTFQIDGDVFLDFQRNIVCAVFGRFSILVGIDAEDGEVTAMTRPHPVVGVGTELTDGRGRCAHHSDILVDGLDKQVIFVCAVERFQFQYGELVGVDFLLLGKAVSHLAEVGRRQIVQSFRIFIFLQLFHHVVRHIEDTVDVSNGQSLAGKFLFTGHGPEAVGQIVMLHRTVLLDVAISAMVVGQYETFRRNDFTGTSSSEVNDSILQTDTVGGVHFVDADIQSEIVHDGSILLFQVGQHPHPFVSMAGEGCENA